MTNGTMEKEESSFISDIMRTLSFTIQKQPREVFYKESCSISQNSQENTCARVSFLIKLQVSTCNLIKKETLARLFSCESCEISKNIFFTSGRLLRTISDNTLTC